MYCACHTHARSTVASPSGLHLGCCFSRCGNIFFRCDDFLGCKAGLSLVRVFFLPRADFFPPRAVFIRCLQNAFFLLQRCFFTAARCFSCCFDFSRCEAAFLLTFFPLQKQLFPLQGVFSCCQIPFQCFFLLRTCVFRTREAGLGDSVQQMRPFCLFGNNVDRVSHFIGWQLIRLLQVFESVATQWVFTTVSLANLLWLFLLALAPFLSRLP